MKRAESMRPAGNFFPRHASAPARSPAVAMLLMLWTVVVSGAAATPVAEDLRAYPTSTPHVIFDSDMVSDCDDIAALALLHVLADRGEVEILATVSSSANPWPAACIDAINTFYGRPELPVGAPRGLAYLSESRFARGVSEAVNHRLKDGSRAPDAVEVYREVLEKARDGSVTVITVGFHTNVANLLRLPAAPDRLSGIDLVRRKVRLWACMGGNFVGHPPVDDLKLGNVNFVRDAAAAHYAITNWPVQLVFVGREIGSVPSGLRVGEQFARLPAGHPLHLGYKLYFRGEVRSRHVADPVTVLYAVRGLRDYWDIETRGGMDLRPDMTFQWRFDRASQQAYLKKRAPGGEPNDRHIEQVIADLLVGRD
jgi:hypothetical protein